MNMKFMFAARTLLHIAVLVTTACHMTKVGNYNSMPFGAFISPSLDSCIPST